MRLFNMSQRRNILLSQAGLTLPEMMVSVFIASIVLYGAVFMLQFITSQSQVISNELAVQDSAAAIRNDLSLTLSQAIDIDFDSSGASLNNFNSGGTSRGKFRTFSATSGISGALETIAIFVRETGVNSAATVPSAIFFQRPTADLPGVLYISHGNKLPLQPDPGDAYYDNLVEFETTPNATTTTVTDPDGTVHQLLVAAEFRTVFRYFLTNPGPTGNWCPVADIASSKPGCTAGAPFKDIESKFSVILRNNVYQRKSTFSGDLPFSTIYYFSMRSPASR
jgi:prepilin-type N-terminal cleavage/methylation domain-containing protein